MVADWSCEAASTVWVMKEPRTPLFSPGDVSVKTVWPSSSTSTFTTSTSSRPATVTSRSCVSGTLTWSFGTTNDTEGGTVSGTTVMPSSTCVVSPDASFASAATVSGVCVRTEGRTYETRYGGVVDMPTGTPPTHQRTCTVPDVSSSTRAVNSMRLPPTGVEEAEGVRMATCGGRSAFTVTSTCRRRCWPALSVATTSRRRTRPTSLAGGVQARVKGSLPAGVPPSPPRVSRTESTEVPSTRRATCVPKAMASSLTVPPTRKGAAATASA
nr:hypothetical protein [Pyxidicoccus parkwaysis]